MRPWSFSSLMVFESCPLHYKFKYIDKLPEETKSEAMERGSLIHLEAEDFVRGAKPISSNLTKFHQDFEALHAKFLDGVVTLEEEWAFNPEWQVTDWRSGWLRLKCDAVCWLSDDHLAVIDYKTGRKFGNEVKHARQLELYALCGFMKFSDVRKITCELWYLDQNELTSMTIGEAKIESMLKTWDKAGRKVSTASNFPANANIHSCRFCPYKEQCNKETSLQLDIPDADPQALATFKRRFK